MEQQNGGRGGGGKQRGYVNYFRVLAGAYLVYLAYQLLKEIWKGTAEMVPLNAIAGAAFAAAGALILRREWRAYQYAKAHKDDPDTWSEDETLPEEARQETEPAAGAEDDADAAPETRERAGEKKEREESGE